MDREALREKSEAHKSTWENTAEALRLKKDRFRLADRFHAVDT